MRRFVLGWKKLGLEQNLGTCLVASTILILSRRGSTRCAAPPARDHGQAEADSEQGARICKVPDGEFDFLGCTFRAVYQAYGRPTGRGRRAWRRSRTRRVTGRARSWQETTELVDMLNRALRGWAKSFVSAPPQSVPRARQLHGCAVAPLRLRYKHDVRQRKKGGSYPLSHLYGHFRLVRPKNTARSRPVVGEGVRFAPRAGCGRSACPVR